MFIVIHFSYKPLQFIYLLCMKNAYDNMFLQEQQQQQLQLDAAFCSYTNKTERT